jgi:hypothetical protein
MSKKLEEFLRNNPVFKLEKKKHLAFLLCKFLKYGWCKNGAPDELCTLAVKRWSKNMKKLIKANKTRAKKMEKFHEQYLVMKQALDHMVDRKKIFSLEQIVDLIHPYTSRDDLPFSDPKGAAGKGKIGILTGVIHITPEGRLNFSYRKQSKVGDLPFRNFEGDKYYKGTFKRPLLNGVDWKKKEYLLREFDTQLKLSVGLDIGKIFKIAELEKITTFFTTKYKKVVLEMGDHTSKDNERQESEDVTGII